METLPFESRMNVTAIALSPSGNILIVVNEGKCYDCSNIVKMSCECDVEMLYTLNTSALLVW